MADYIPNQGDIVWLHFDPQAGHEQAGHRPALVLSPQKYNRISGMMICCPMTTKIKGYPFEVLDGTGSAILADQVKNLDWQARKATFKASITSAALTEVQGKIKTLLGL